MYRLAAILLVAYSASVTAQLTDSVTSKSEVALQTSVDSLQLVLAESYSFIRNEFDSLSAQLTDRAKLLDRKIDSLQTLGQSTSHLTAKLDSLHHQQMKLWNGHTQKLEDLKASVREHLNSVELPPGLSEKASSLTGFMDKLHMGTPLDDLPTSFPISTKISDAGGLPGGGIPGIPDVAWPNTPNVQLPNANLPSINGQLPAHVELPTTAEAAGKMIEEKVSGASPLQDVQQEMGKVSEVTSLAQDLNDKEALKQQSIEKVQQQVVDHFAGKESELTEAMDMLAKYRKKYGSFQNLEELTTRHRNLLHKAPLVERLLPGLGLQFFNGEFIMADVNPYLGYRFNTRLTAGAGWNERIVFGSGKDNRVYGPRGYAEHAIWRSMSVHLSVEYLNTYVPSQFSSTRRDEAGREWVFTPMGGIKKEYGFIKSVKGTFYMLYNLHDPFHRSPYSDKLIMKMGFEFPMKKKTKGNE